MGVNELRLEQALSVIKKNVKISDIFREFGCFQDEIYRGDEVVIPCPFHDDGSPSLGINDDKAKWHCFGCGSGGNAVSAYRRLSFIKKGITISYATAVDQLIYNNPEAKALLPFATVSSIDEKLITESFSVNRFNPNTIVEKSMNDVYRYMQKSGKTSFQDIAMAVDLMISNMTPEMILNTFCEQKKYISKDESNRLSVADLLSSADW